MKDAVVVNDQDLSRLKSYFRSGGVEGLRRELAEELKGGSSLWRRSHGPKPWRIEEVRSVGCVRHDGMCSLGIRAPASRQEHLLKNPRELTRSVREERMAVNEEHGSISRILAEAVPRDIARCRMVGVERHRPGLAKVGLAVISQGNQGLEPRRPQSGTQSLEIPRRHWLSHDGVTIAIKQIGQG
jgi:hypothetical protein